MGSDGQQSTSESWSVPGSTAELTPARLRLIKRAQKGDSESLRELWQLNRGWVAGILLAFKSRDAELEDLLQEVAVTMVRKIESVREPGALRPWLRAVAINAARLDARTRGRRPEGRTVSMLDQPAANGDSVDMAHDRREDGKRLLNMVLDLPEAYREPLLLRSVKGMSYREISAITALPETTIETRIARGRRMLRERARQHKLAPEPERARDERMTR